MPVASIRRSTPGSTFRYSATLPETTGAGSAAGQYIATLRPAESVTVTSGPAVRRNLGLMARQTPCTLARTGNTLDVIDSIPFGCASTSDVGVGKAGTITGLPVSRARDSAAPSARALGVSRIGLVGLVGRAAPSTALRGPLRCLGPGANAESGRRPAIRCPTNGLVARTIACGAVAGLGVDACAVPTAADPPTTVRPRPAMTAASPRTRHAADQLPQAPDGSAVRQL